MSAVVERGVSPPPLSLQEQAQVSIFELVVLVLVFCIAGLFYFFFFFFVASLFLRAGLYFVMIQMEGEE